MVINPVGPSPAGGHAQSRTSGGAAGRPGPPRPGFQ